MHHLKVASLIGALVALATQLEPAAASCCTGKADAGGHCGNDLNTKCKDSTCGTPCCAHGPCNIFCCNCDGGCRNNLQFDFEALRVAGGEDEGVTCMSQCSGADVDADGQLSFAEWAVHALDVQTLEPLAKRWREFDTRGKGYLTEAEALDRKA